MNCRSLLRFFFTAALLPCAAVSFAQSPPQSAVRTSVAAPIVENGSGSLIVWRVNEPGFSVLGSTRGQPVESFVGTLRAISGQVHGGDINGDGLMDFVAETGAGQRSVEIVLGSRAGYGEPAVWNVPDRSTLILALADANGDGRDDLLLQRDAGSTRNWDVAISNGQRFGRPTVWTSTTTPGVEPFAYVDANGDGRSDLWLHYVNPRSGDRRFQLRLSDGLAFSGISDWFRGDRALMPFSTADANGDGRPDLWVRSDAGNERRWDVHLSNGRAFAGNSFRTSTTTANVEELAAADATGDGRADLWLTYVTRGSRNWQIREVDAGQFGRIGNWHAARDPATGTAGVVDANGDGLADLWLFPAGAAGRATQVALLLSRGQQFAAGSPQELRLAFRSADPATVTQVPAEPGIPDSPSKDQPPPKPQVPIVPVGISLYYGYASATGELSTLDGTLGGGFADAYEVEAREGQSLTVTAAYPSHTTFVMSGADPDGRPIPGTIDSGLTRIEVNPASAGVYTFTVSTSNPDSLGRYYLYATGPGEEFTGEVDPFRDRRDSGVPYDSVDLELKEAGWYRFELFDEFRDGRLVIRDAEYNDVPTTGQNRNQTATIEGGTHHIIIEAKFTGGPWRLVVTYLGPVGY